MTRRPDGSWSIAHLAPLPKLDDDALPEIRFENGTIEIFDPTKAVACALTLRDVNVALAPLADPKTDGTVSMPSTTTRRLRVEGSASGDYFHQVSFNGEIDPDRPDLNVRGKIDGVEISPEMRNVLPDGVGTNLSVLGALRGETEVGFWVKYDPQAMERWTFDFTGQLTRGRIDDPRLPHALTEIRATAHVDNGGFSIQEFKARSNQAVLSLTCKGGFRPSSPMTINADVSQLALDEQFQAILPHKFQEAWHKLRPEGVIDASVTLRYDGHDWQPQVRIACRDVSFAPHKFPYRLEHTTGLLEVKDDLLHMDLATVSENHPLHIVGEFRNPTGDSTGWLHVASDALPIDEKLIKALPVPAQTLVRSLDLKGNIGFQFEAVRDAVGKPFHQHLLLRASECGLRYDRFRYALSKVRGDVEMIDGDWRFRNLEGFNGTSRVTGDGALLATPRGDELSLRLTAVNVPLEGELREALQPGMRQVWALLQPHGIIDLTANIHYLGQPELVEVAVRAEPRSDTCSFEPVRFPYRLENVQGIFSFGDGRLKFERCSAWHGPVKMACNGACTFQPDGSWQLRLDRVSVDRLRMDRELMQALPPQLKKRLGELNLTGPMSLQGSVVHIRSANAAEPMTSLWNLSVGMNQVGVDCGLRLENIYGKVAVSGWSDGTRFQTRGELDLDSLTCQDHQFTQMLGPFKIDDQEAIFGSGVAQRDNQNLPPGQPRAQPRPLTAKIFGGTVYGDGWALLGPQPQFGLQASLVNADLATCARELGSSDRNLRGRVNGGVALGGFGRNRTSLRGEGGLQLRDANIYELPVMISMLKILNFRVPDPNAFSKSDAAFRVEGEHIYFNKLDFNGDAISLVGKGEMNFQGDARLVFTAVVGRADSGLPVLRNFFTGASQQFMQIRVDGNLRNPDIRQEAFPGVNQALKNLDISKAGP